MGLDSYLPLKKSGQSVIDRNLPYRFLRGQPLNNWSRGKTLQLNLFAEAERRETKLTVSLVTSL